VFLASGRATRHDLSTAMYQLAQRQVSNVGLLFSRVDGRGATISSVASSIAANPYVGYYRRD